MKKLINRFIRWLGYMSNQEHCDRVGVVWDDLEKQWQIKFDILELYMQKKQNDLTALHAFKPGELFDLYKLRESIGCKIYSDNATVGFINYPNPPDFMVGAGPYEIDKTVSCILEKDTLCYQDEKIELYTYQGNYVRTCNPGDEAKLLQWLRDIVTTDN